MLALRNVASFLALPFVATVVVPAFLAGRSGAVIRFPANAAIAILAIAFVAAGVVLFVSSLYEFVTRGRGTLAPWDPPRNLVVHGPYRFVRNPMITGVLLLLIAEAMFLQTTAHGWWAAAFALVNAIYIPLVEEPQLERRFGEPYRVYCRNVPRLLPRLSAWKGPSETNHDEQ